MAAPTVAVMPVADGGGAPAPAPCGTGTGARAARDHGARRGHRGAGERGHPDPRDHLEARDADPSELLREQQRADADDRASERAEQDAAPAAYGACDPESEQRHSGDDGDAPDGARHRRQRGSARQAHPDRLVAAARRHMDSVQTDAVRRDALVEREGGVVVHGAGRHRRVDDVALPHRSLDLDAHARRVGRRDRLHAVQRVDVELQRMARVSVVTRGLIVDPRLAHLLRGRGA